MESLNISVKGSHWFYISNFKSLYIFYKIIDDLVKTNQSYKTDYVLDL